MPSTCANLLRCAVSQGAPEFEFPPGTDLVRAQAILGASVLAHDWAGRRAARVRAVPRKAWSRRDCVNNDDQPARFAAAVIVQAIYI